jgi:uncharacterized protein (DUF488 family)
MPMLRTIGYEGFQTGDWLEALRASHIEVVIDVRDMPLSRRKGFSKTALREALASSGVDYVHFRSLGNPKELREALKSGMSFEDFSETFGRLLDERGDALRELLMIASERSACLVCLEEDPARCHRSLVADRVSDLSHGTIRVKHIRHAC